MDQKSVSWVSFLTLVVSLILIVLEQMSAYYTSIKISQITQQLPATSDFFWTTWFKALGLDAGPKILGKIADAVFTGTFVYLLFERFTLDAIKERIYSPESVLSFISKNRLHDYLVEFISRHYKLDNDAAQSIAKTLEYGLKAEEQYDNEFDTISLLDYDKNSKYFKIHCKRQIIINNSSNSLLTFVCRIGEPRNPIMFSPKHFISWHFLLAPGDESLPSNAFNVIQVKINNNECKIERAESTGNEIIFHANSKLQSLNQSEIIVEWEVLQARCFGFVSCHAKRLTNGLSIDLDYSGFPSIQNCYCAHFFNSVQTPRIEHSAHHIHVSIRDWLLPPSGVVFTWTEIGENNVNRTIQAN